MRAISALAAGAVLFALPALAAEEFPNVEYITGKGGFNEKIKGTLTVDAAEIKFSDKKGRSIFSIPVKHVVDATQTRELDTGSVGKKLLIGFLATKHREYLRLETKSPQGAEVVVFQTKKNQSQGMAAKINFHRDNRR